MKNEELAALLQAMDLKWDQRAESQMTELRAVLEERLAKVLPTNSPIQHGDSSTVREPSRRSTSSQEGREVNLILKNLRIKVARFDGSNVDDWIYKINKFFDLQQVEHRLRLMVVPFHLDGVPSKWFQSTVM